MCCSVELRAKLGLSAALVSVLLGLSGAACFSYFGQYTTAMWCGIASVYALGVVIMHCTALQYGARPNPHSVVSQILPGTLLVGVLGMVFSLGITVYGLAYAITYNEALNRKSHYLLAVWGFMTFKWAFYMFQLSRHYNRILSIEEEDAAQLVGERSNNEGSSRDEFRGLDGPSVIYQEEDPSIIYQEEDPSIIYQEEDPSVTYQDPIVNV